MNNIIDNISTEASFIALEDYDYIQVFAYDKSGASFIIFKGDDEDSHMQKATELIKSGHPFNLIRALKHYSKSNTFASFCNIGNILTFLNKDFDNRGGKYYYKKAKNLANKSELGTYYACMYQYYLNTSKEEKYYNLALYHGSDLCTFYKNGSKGIYSPNLNKYVTPLTITVQIMASFPNDTYKINPLILCLLEFNPVAILPVGQYVSLFYADIGCNIMGGYFQQKIKNVSNLEINLLVSVILNQLYQGNYKFAKEIAKSLPEKDKVLLIKYGPTDISVNDLICRGILNCDEYKGRLECTIEYSKMYQGELDLNYINNLIIMIDSVKTFKKYEKYLNDSGKKAYDTAIKKKNIIKKLGFDKIKYSDEDDELENALDQVLGDDLEEIDNLIINKLMENNDWNENDLENILDDVIGKDKVNQILNDVRKIINNKKINKNICKKERDDYYNEEDEKKGEDEGDDNEIEADYNNHIGQVCTTLAKFGLALITAHVVFFM
jgi:hypothetical protein